MLAEMDLFPCLLKDVLLMRLHISSSGHGQKGSLVALFIAKMCYFKSAKLSEEAEIDVF